MSWILYYKYIYTEVLKYNIIYRMIHQASHPIFFNNTFIHILIFGKSDYFFQSFQFHCVLIKECPVVIQNLKRDLPCYTISGFIKI